MTARPVGFDATVIWNCVAKLAVYVASAAIVIVRGFVVTASFHCVNTYRTLVAPGGCGLWAAIACVVPAGSRTLSGDGIQAEQQLAPSPVHRPNSNRRES